MTEQRVDAVILGAGYGGLGMAAQLTRAGLDDYVVLERSAAIGGVWRDNSYPGAACDTQSHIYCYSFFLNLRVSRMFAGRDELLAYLSALVEQFGLGSRIRFQSEVVEARWVAAERRWRIAVDDGSVYLARTFIPAWGQLSTPLTPHFRGIEDFQGATFHSARWNHDIDLRGKRVASIGAAASAVQYVPEIAPVVGSLTVFQRSANYILPRDQIVFTDQQLDDFDRDPELYRRSRREIHEMREAGFTRLLHDTIAQQQTVAQTRAHLEVQVADPVLRQKLTPDYEYGCKRVLRSDEYYPALQLPQVELVTEGIEGFTATGIRTLDGVERTVDVVIFGTGFRSQAFQGDLVVLGQDGESLADRWGDSPEAYLGITVDGFPNMFLVYGPNTNLNHNSVVSMMEAQQQYIVQALRFLIEHPDTELDVEQSVIDEFVDEVQERLQASSFSSDCSSWYKNAAGRVVNNWCGTVGEYQELTAEVRLSDYAVAR